LGDGTVWIYFRNFTSFFVATFTWYHQPKSNISNVEPIKLRKLRWAEWPPLWSSDQRSWLQIQKSQVRFPALQDFLRSSGSGTGSTQPRELRWPRNTPSIR
jgi:hypothetical protein